MTICSNDVLFILYVVHNPSLHLENAVLMQGPHELLSSVNFIIHICKCGVKQIQSLLLRQIKLSDDLNDIFPNLNRLVADVIPRQKEDGEDEHNEVVNDTPCYPESIALGVLDAVLWWLLCRLSILGGEVPAEMRILVLLRSLSKLYLPIGIILTLDEVDGALNRPEDHEGVQNKL